MPNIATLLRRHETADEDIAAAACRQLETHTLYGYALPQLRESAAAVYCRATWTCAARATPPPIVTPDAGTRQPPDGGACCRCIRHCDAEVAAAFIYASR